MEITVKVNYKNEKLQKLRQAAGLSQSQLAEAAGVNVRMYQKYEQGAKLVIQEESTDSTNTPKQPRLCRKWQ